MAALGYNNAQDIIGAGPIKNQGLASSYGFPHPGSEIGYSYLRNAASGLYPLAGQQIGFANQLEAPRQSAIMNALTMLQRGNRLGTTELVRQHAYDDASRNLRQQDVAARGAGLGVGARLGMQEGAFNNASDTANQYYNYQISPQGDTDALNQALQIIASGQVMPSLEQLRGLVEALKIRVQPSSNGGALSTLQGLAGVAGSVAPYFVK